MRLHAVEIVVEDVEVAEEGGYVAFLTIPRKDRTKGAEVFNAGQEITCNRHCRVLGRSRSKVRVMNHGRGDRCGVDRDRGKRG